jgi:hypothetical protein
MVTDSLVKVEEKGKKATFVNHVRAEYARVRVDRCLIKGEIAADFVVARDGAGHVIIELKGKDVAHACEQIIATARLLRSCPNQPRRIAGLVVCAEFPKGIARGVQRLRESFAKEFRGPIHVVARNEQYELDKVLAFKGPF